VLVHKFQGLDDTDWVIVVNVLFLHNHTSPAWSAAWAPWSPGTAKVEPRRVSLVLGLVTEGVFIAGAERGDPLAEPLQQRGPGSWRLPPSGANVSNDGGLSVPAERSSNASTRPGDPKRISADRLGVTVRAMSLRSGDRMRQESQDASDILDGRARRTLWTSHRIPLPARTPTAAFRAAKAAPPIQRLSPVPTPVTVSTTGQTRAAAKTNHNPRRPKRPAMKPRANTFGITVPVYGPARIGPARRARSRADR
jgi:hypothetical protein